MLYNNVFEIISAYLSFLFPWLWEKSFWFLLECCWCWNGAPPPSQYNKALNGKSRIKIIHKELAIGCCILSIINHMSITGLLHSSEILIAKCGKWVSWQKYIKVTFLAKTDVTTNSILLNTAYCRYVFSFLILSSY